MTLRSRLFCSLLLGACWLPAQASQHLISVREVYVGPANDPAAHYVMLQMQAAGENLVKDHALTVFGTTGNVLGNIVFDRNVANGANQAFILIATPQAQARFNITADFTLSTLLPAAGGKVCWDVFDCFSWGSYSGGGTNPSLSGSPFNPAAGLTPDRAVRRDISGGGSPTLLEGADDTNDSAADFDFAAAPGPIRNAGSPPVPGGGGGGGYGGGGSGGYGSGAMSLSLFFSMLLGWGLRRLARSDFSADDRRTA